MHLADTKITTNRSIQLKTFKAHGYQKCLELAVQNAEDLYRVLEWNLEKDILVYRVSSDIIPWATEWLLGCKHLGELETSLARAGKFAAQHGMRLSFHPGPFNCLGSPNGDVVKKTIVDLECHSLTMDMLEQPVNRLAKINIHIGGSYGDKPGALERVVNNFELLSRHTRARLTFENDDTPSLYSVQDLYGVYERIGTSIVFDGHHWEVGSRSGSYSEDFLKAYRTWDVVPTVHWSNSRREYEEPGAQPSAHSDWYYKPMLVPDGMPVDIMLEAKQKDKALLKYRGDYYGIQD